MYEKMYQERANGSFREILQNSVDGYPWGFPCDAPGGIEGYRKDIQSKFQAHRKALDDAWNTAKKSKWEIARILHEIVVTGSFRAYSAKREELEKHWKEENPDRSWKDFPYAYIGGMASEGNPSTLYAFAKEELGIGRTDLYTMLAVYEKFEGQNGQPSYEASLFTFSQLVEMLPLDYDQRKEIQPNWTIREIREYKRSLKAPQTGADSVQTSELDQALDLSDKFHQMPEMKCDAVQTSELNRDDFEEEADFEELKDPAPARTAAESVYEETKTLSMPNTKYDRFKGFDRFQLCDLILELEEKIKRLELIAA